MSRQDPRPGCVEVALGGGHVLPPSALVALEDYARVLTRAAAASVLVSGGDEGPVHGIHLCAPELPPAAVMEDLEAFVRDLAGPASEGLGWS